MTSTSTPKHVTLGQLAGQWELDPRTSEIRIEHKTMWGLATVKGQFQSFAGSGSVSADGAVTGAVTIGAASIDTKNKKRDEHLRSKDFFDAQQFPSIAVEVTRAAIRDGAAQVRSSLVVKGIREPLTFTGRIEEAAAGALTLTGTFTADRERFGMSWNQAGMVRGLTTVSFRLVFHRAGS
jgi:polyisoprenoid-binding protein YceI